MKTYELARAINDAAEWLKPTQTADLVAIANELEHASAKKTKKATRALVMRIERKSRPSVHFETACEWIPCDDDGDALTPTGRKMKARHSILGYK